MNGQIHGEPLAQGELLAIAMRNKPRVPMQELSDCAISVEAGLQGDFRGAAPDRQVTILTQEGWRQACEAVGQDLPWTTRRANLFIRGLDLKGRIGATLRIGSVALVITDECEPCHIMDAAHEGLRQALVTGWRAGVTCRVVQAGHVAIGDKVRLEG